MAATALSVLKTKTIAKRRFTASAWTAGHLQHTIDVLKVKHPGTNLRILQTCFNTDVELSAGSHDFDGVFDVWIDEMPGDKAQRFLRGQGWAAWHRHTGKFANNIHIHMATIPPGLPDPPTRAQVGKAYKALGLKVGTLIDGGITATGVAFTSSQIVDYYQHAFGLKDQHTPGSDKSWFPKDIAKTIYQPEDDDMTKEEMLQVLRSKAGQEAIAQAMVKSKLIGQTDRPAGRSTGASITGIYNLLLRIAKKIGA
jgi:hypothetical protein